MKSDAYIPVFGVRAVLPLRGFPRGKVRLTLRNQDFARAYVKTKHGIRCFIVAEYLGKWVPLPGCEQGLNRKARV